MVPLGGDISMGAGSSSDAGIGVAVGVGVVITINSKYPISDHSPWTLFESMACTRQYRCGKYSTNPGEAVKVYDVSVKLHCSMMLNCPSKYVFRPACKW